MCLTYCVPLVDSLCSFVRVQHVSGVACVFRKERRVCVGVRVCVSERMCERACVSVCVATFMGV